MAEQPVPARPEPADNPPPPAGDAGAARARPPSPRRILIAEDEHLVAPGLVAALERLGYQPLPPVPDGEALLGLAAGADADLALVDIRMPRRDGLDAAAELYARWRVPAIIVTGHSTPADIAGARVAGVFGYLIKPVGDDQLRAAIEVGWGRFLSETDAQERAEALQRRLADRRTIEKAKWVLVQRRQLSEDEALRTLQKQSRQTRRPMIDIARQILDASELI